MDKKNTFLGILFIGVAIWMFHSTSKQQRQLADAANTSAMAQVQNLDAALHPAKPVVRADLLSAYAPEENIKPQSLYLENDFFKVTLTSKGAAISSVELLKYQKNQNSEQPYVFNETVKVNSLNFAFPSQGLGFPIDFTNNFSVVKKSADSVTFEYIVSGKFKIIRTYSIIKDSKEGIANHYYTINCQNSIENISAENLNLERIFLCLGMASPTAGDLYGGNLALTLFDGSKAHFAKSSSFIDSSGFLGIGASKAKPYLFLETQPVVWGSVKNQFFAAIFTPKNAIGLGGYSYPIVINPDAADKYMKNGFVGYMGFNVDPILPQRSWNLDGTFYVGPKEIGILQELGKGQEAIMDFGWLSFISKPLLSMLNLIHHFTASISPEWAWGWSIVILTIFVRIVILPLTAMQIRSSRRMQALQKPISEIKEKFKDDKQRIGQETMKLYGEYGINPFAGCFPVLIQLPIFIGLYFMLQSASEIRFAHFLWINDLSLPDTIDGLSIFGFPIHILPLLNAVFSFYQMHLTPMPSTDKAQKFMFKMMPFIMLFIFYSFPSGLILYWTVQSIVGIAQTYYILKTKDNVILQKKSPKKGGFMQRIQATIEETKKLEEQGYSKEQIKEVLSKRARQQREQKLAERQGLEKPRKKNPGGRSTKPKR